MKEYTMLSKPAILLLGLINEEPKGAYEITKRLELMNMKWWFYVSDSTVYSTLRTLEKKQLITGKTEKNGNMPERVVYSISTSGREALLMAIKKVFMTMDYDTTTFSIAATYMNIFSKEEQIELLESRKKLLNEYSKGIEENISKLSQRGIPALVIDNIERMLDIVEVELRNVDRMIDTIKGDDVFASR